MLKKFLAGLTAIALSLGMVVLTAGPASAHHNTINAVVSCNTGTEGTWKVTWSVINSEGDKGEVIIASSDEVLVPVGTEIKKGKTATFVEYFDTPTSKTLTLTGQWTNGVTQQNSGSVSSTQFSGDCLPDDTKTKKVWICHANNGEGTGGFVKNEVDVDSIIKTNGHAQHHNQRDIIPPFTYVKQGVPGSFPGLNWNPPYSQAFLDAGCAEPTVTPVAPTFTEAVCTAPGQPGQASYVIPSTVGIKYTVQINGIGGFAEKSANTYYVPVGTTVEVQAVALTGYVLGTPDYWSTTFLNKDCIVTTTPSPATFSVLECVEGQPTQPSYTIPATVGVKYTVQINGAGGFVEKAANTYPVAQGTTVEVKAVALTGYVLTGDVQWSKTFGTIDCRVTPATPDFTSAVCTPNDGPGSYGDASYTIPTTTGVQYQVRFFSFGSWADVSAGIHYVNAGQYVEIRAIAVGDYVLKGTVKWTKNFTAPDCETDVIPVEPTWTEAVCTGEQEVGSASYTIPVIEGVRYQKLDGATWVDVPTGVNQIVDGTLLTLRAIPLPGYEFPGPDVRLYVHFFTNFNESKDCLVPMEPTFDPQECTAPGDPSQATYTIPTDEGVKYQIWDGDSWENIDAGTYDVNAFPTEVKIRAITKHQYSFLPGTTTEWTFDFTSIGDCIVDAPVGPVVASDQKCVIDDLDTGAAHYESGTITIPNTAHVTYSVNGIVKGAGEYHYAPGTYTISAEAEPGYTLKNVPDPWTVTIKEAVPCGQFETLGDVLPTASFSQTTCSASGSYTLGAEPVENAVGVIWTVSGGLPNTLGTHAVTTAGTVSITATAAPGWGLSGDDDGIKQWSYEFTSLPDDCLPTLALTGAPMAVGLIGLWGVLSAVGVLLIVARNRRTVV